MTGRRPLPLHPLPVTLPPATAALLRLWHGERPEEVIRRALTHLAISDGLVDTRGRQKRRHV